MDIKNKYTYTIFYYFRENFNIVYNIKLVITNKYIKLK